MRVGESPRVRVDLDQRHLFALAQEPVHQRPERRYTGIVEVVTSSG